MSTRRWRWLFAWLLLVGLPACDEIPVLDGDASVSLDGAPTDTGVSSAVDAGVPVDAGPPADFDDFVEYQMAVGGIPGAAVSIVTATDVLLSRSYGFADLEADRAVDEHTLFIMASVSKTLAATRAMQLVEAGTLDLDAPVETYLSFAPRHVDYVDDAITTRMLLTHTSGIEDDFLVLNEVSYSDQDPPVSMGAFSVGYLTPGGAYYGESGHWGERPLTRRAYSNAGFGVVGHVLEEAEGASFRDATRAAIFEPLDMDGAGWFLEDVDASRLAVEYAWNGRRYTRLPQHGFAFYPASSLRVSVAGLSRFARALLNRGELEGARILSEDSVAEMFRIQHPDISAGQALTFSLRRVGGNLYIGHSGATFGGSTQFLLSEDMSHAIVLITNSDAYVRDRLGLPDGRLAMEAILERLDAETRAF